MKKLLLVFSFTIATCSKAPDENTITREPACEAEQNTLETLANQKAHHKAEVEALKEALKKNTNKQVRHQTK